MEKSNYLKPPKKEEEEENQGQVPDILNAHTSTYTIKAHPDEGDVIMDELEGILGIEDDESLPGYGQLGLQLNWEGEFSTSQLFQDAEFWDGNSNDVGVKFESGYGHWDFEEKKASLNLSLNYQEVLEAWSDRRPLWAPSNSYMGEVPVMEEATKIWSRRQASVMRYKEKRQNRLFSKKIRYEVRKLNADNRPRIKGRFVKRVGDKMQKGC